MNPIHSNSSFDEPLVPPNPSEQRSLEGKVHNTFNTHHPQRRASAPIHIPWQFKSRRKSRLRPLDIPKPKPDIKIAYSQPIPATIDTGVGEEPWQEVPLSPPKETTPLKEETLNPVYYTDTGPIEIEEKKIGLWSRLWRGICCVK